MGGGSASSARETLRVGLLRSGPEKALHAGSAAQPLIRTSGEHAQPDGVARVQSSNETSDGHLVRAGDAAPARGWRGSRRRTTVVGKW